MSKKEQEYNGWKNKSTWNVSLWLENDEQIYTMAVIYMKARPNSRRPYYNFIKSLGMEYDKTPDGFKWLSGLLDYPALNAMMRELAQ